jgi:hypothetical protein
MANVSVWLDKFVLKSLTAAGEARNVPLMPSGKIVLDVK